MQPNPKIWGQAATQRSSRNSALLWRDGGIMELERLIELINENHRDEGCLDFPRIVDVLPERMNAQSSDIDGVETEWVWQVTNQFDCYQGELAYQMNDGRFLIFGFAG